MTNTEERIIQNDFHDTISLIRQDSGLNIRVRTCNIATGTFSLTINNGEFNTQRNMPVDALEFLDSPQGKILAADLAKDIFCDYVEYLASSSKEPKLELTVDQQVTIMETQLSHFDDLMEKLQYMSMAFDPDPAFTKQARDIVRSNISKGL
jgi:hypothetical protein